MADGEEDNSESGKVELSLVVCVFDEEDAIKPFTDCIDAVMPSLGVRSHEIVFVDDGSYDG